MMKILLWGEILFDRAPSHRSIDLFSAALEHDANLLEDTV